ncbi:MAG: AraC family transcriptional regulator [Pseudobutyrivibrio sp.]|nr:AraC family transcriptional regulator [Pseudobutyrivibrio sp.]
MDRNRDSQEFILGFLDEDIDSNNMDIAELIPSKETLKIRKQIHKGYANQIFVETNSDGDSYSTKRLVEMSNMHYVRTGNINMIKQAIAMRGELNYFSPEVDKYIGEVSDNPLRQAISMFVSSITLATRAAMDGGLPEHIAYAISDNYIRYSLPVTDVKIINYLNACALYDFTSQVYHYKYRNCGPIVRRCCEYIQRNMHSKITLHELSDLTGKSTGYISECFLHDLGMRPIEYIRKEKLSYASNILTFSDISVSAISDLLAFPSTSAFITYFKREYGCTPLAYRNDI